MIWSEKACIWQQELFIARNNTVIFCSRTGLNIAYRTHILWMDTYEYPLICQELVNPANLAHLISLPNHIHHSPDLTIFISAFSLTTFPDPSQIRPLSPSNLHTSPSSLRRSFLSPSVHPLLPDSVCTFYRSDPFFILSESPNNSCMIPLIVIFPAANCSFR